MPSGIWFLRMRRTKEDAEKTRKAILESALEVFHSRGVSNSSLIEIAEHAGVTRGAIYWHFKDKQSLYFALYETLTEEYASRPEDIEKKQYNDLDEFIEDVKRPLRLLKEDSRFRMFMSVVFSRMEYIEDMYPIIENEQNKQFSLVKAYSHALEDLQKRGLIAGNVNYKQFAYILYSFVDGVYDSGSFDANFYPEDLTPDILLDGLFQSIRP